MLKKKATTTKHYDLKRCRKSIDNIQHPFLIFKKSQKIRKRGTLIQLKKKKSVKNFWSTHIKG